MYKRAAHITYVTTGKINLLCTSLGTACAKDVKHLCKFVNLQYCTVCLPCGLRQHKNRPNVSSARRNRRLNEVGVRKGLRLQNILLLQFYAMIPKQGRDTARSTPWAPPPAYDKKNARDSVGRVDGYDGLSHKPDVLPRNRKGMEKRRFATWNVGSMTGRGRELVEEMGRRNIDVMCVQETKWRGNAARELGEGYKIIHSGESNKRNGVGIILSRK